MCAGGCNTGHHKILSGVDVGKMRKKTTDFFLPLFLNKKINQPTNSLDGVLLDLFKKH
jgi:hypothetical protein